MELARLPQVLQEVRNVRSHLCLGIYYVQNFLPFRLSVHLPAKEQTDLYPHTFTGEHGGKSGPIQVTIPPHVHTIDKLFQETMIQMGLKRIDDPYGGDVRLELDD